MPYKLYKWKKPNVSHLHVLGCKCFLLANAKDYPGKIDVKSNKAIFIGYFSFCKAYKVFNKRTLLVEKFIHVSFDESTSYVHKVFNDDDEQIIL